MSNPSIAELVKIRQNQFIETRKDIEFEVDQYLSSLESLDEDIKQQCNVVDGQRAREVLPALWEEPFNEEVYNQQLKQLAIQVNAVKAICDKLNEEALACLQGSP